MPTYPTTSWRAREALMDRKPFKTSGAFSATEGHTRLPWGHRLPADYAATYWEQSDQIVYTVWSYNTPIAWVLDDGTVVQPPVKYSVTTSKHQGMLYALHLGALGSNADTLDSRVGIRDAAERERQRERDRRAQYRAEASVRDTTRAYYADAAAHRAAVAAAASGASPQDTVHAYRAAREDVYNNGVSANDHERWAQQDAAILEANDAIRQADREDIARLDQEQRTGAPTPTDWSDIVNNHEPYRTTDGAIYSDSYLRRKG